MSTRATLVGLVVAIPLASIVTVGWWPALLTMMATILVVAPLRARRVFRREG